MYEFFNEELKKLIELLKELLERALRTVEVIEHTPTHTLVCTVSIYWGNTDVEHFLCKQGFLLNGYHGAIFNPERVIQAIIRLIWMC